MILIHSPIRFLCRIIITIVIPPIFLELKPLWHRLISLQITTTNNILSTLWVGVHIKSCTQGGWLLRIKPLSFERLLRFLTLLICILVLLKLLLMRRLRPHLTSTKSLWLWEIGQVSSHFIKTGSLNRTLTLLLSPHVHLVYDRVLLSLGLVVFILVVSLL